MPRCRAYLRLPEWSSTHAPATLEGPSGQLRSLNLRVRCGGLFFCPRRDTSAGQVQRASATRAVDGGRLPQKKAGDTSMEGRLTGMSRGVNVPRQQVSRSPPSRQNPALVGATALDFSDFGPPIFQMPRRYRTPVSSSSVNSAVRAKTRATIRFNAAESA